MAVQRRIMGLENEYGITCTIRGQRRLSPDEVARYLFRRVVSWGRSSNVFLANGARLYLDVGSHPEYATPECDSVYQVICHDRAGERILERLVDNAEERLAEEVEVHVLLLFLLLDLSIAWSIHSSPDKLYSSGGHPLFAVKL